MSKAAWTDACGRPAALGGIIVVNRNGLRWRDALAAFGQPKTLYNGWPPLSRMDVLARRLMEVAQIGQDSDTLMAVRQRPRFVQKTGGPALDLSMPAQRRVAGGDVENGSDAYRKLSF